MSIGVQRSVDTVIDILKQRLASRVETGMELRRQHANTVTWLDNEPPDAVVFGQSSEEVALVVQVAGEHRVPAQHLGDIGALLTAAREHHAQRLTGIDQPTCSARQQQHPLAR